MSWALERPDIVSSVAALRMLPNLRQSLFNLTLLEEPRDQLMALLSAVHFILTGGLNTLSSWPEAKKFLIQACENMEAFLAMLNAPRITPAIQAELLSNFLPKIDPPRHKLSRCLSTFVFAVATTVSPLPSGQGENGTGEKLTIIVTTSPTQCNPSTEMIVQVLESFTLVKGLETCPIIIAADGCVVGDKAKWKSGRVTKAQHASYAEYLDNLEQLYLPSSTICHGRTRVLRLPTRVGFGYALKAALAYVMTPYVLVVQHDYSFVKSFDLRPVLSAMDAHPDVLRYVGFVSTTTMEYALKRGIQYSSHHIKTEVIELSSEPFCKLLFWYDKTHLARVETYRDFVFGASTVVRKGDFPEDRLGHVMICDLKAKGIAAHAKYGTFLWYPKGGTEIVIRHSNGRGFRTAAQKVQAEAASRAAGMITMISQREEDKMNDEEEEVDEEDLGYTLDM